MLSVSAFDVLCLALLQCCDGPGSRKDRRDLSCPLRASAYYRKLKISRRAIDVKFFDRSVLLFFRWVGPRTRSDWRCLARQVYVPSIRVHHPYSSRIAVTRTICFANRQRASGTHEGESSDRANRLSGMACAKKILIFRTSSGILSKVLGICVSVRRTPCSAVASPLAFRGWTYLLVAQACLLRSYRKKRDEGRALRW